MKLNLLRLAYHALNQQLFFKSCVSLTLLLSPGISLAQTTALGCSPNGVPYATDSEGGPRVPIPQTLDPQGPAANPPGGYKGIGPATPRPGNPQNPQSGGQINAQDNAEGQLIIMPTGGPITPSKSGIRVNGPQDKRGFCNPDVLSERGLPAPQCGADADKNGKFKKCILQAMCLPTTCQCVTLRPPPKTDTTTGDGGGAPRANLSQLTDVDSQKLEGIYSTTARANRGGSWYWFAEYPGYLVNVHTGYPGAEMEMYFARVKQTWAARGAGSFQLVKETDAAGNVTEYFYNTAGALTRKRLPGNVQLDFVPLPSASGYTLITSRCDASYNNCRSVGQDYEYVLNANGQVVTMRELAPAPYVSEPSSPTSVHNLLGLQNGPLTTSYSYTPSGLLTSVTKSRGSVTVPVITYEYYASNHPYAGRLWKTIDHDGRETIFTYSANQVIKTESDGAVTDAYFDGFNRIVQYTVTPPAGTAGGVPYVAQRVSYAGTSCDKLITKIEVDNGSGVYRTEYDATWDASLFRLLSVTTPGPNGNFLTTTYSEHVDWLDGNFAQTVSGPIGDSKVVPIFVSMLDPTDARQQLVSLTTFSAPVTNVNNETFVDESRVVFNPNGSVDYSVSGKLSTKNSYDEFGLLKQVDSGPALPSGLPNMTHPASYSVMLTRDSVTGDVLSTAEGNPANPKITSYTYQNNALTSVQSGLSQVRYYYNIWGALAAKQVYAVDSAGQPFAPGARTWWSSYTIRDALGLRVLAEATDIGDPRSPNPELAFTSYTYNSQGQVESTVPHFGNSTFFTYNGWGDIKSIHRNSLTGILLAEYSQTPTTATERVLSGENSSGVPTYETTTRSVTPAGYLAAISSSNGRQVRFSYTDLGQVASTEAAINGTLMAKNATEYDEWGRVVKSYRFNPTTLTKELVSSLVYRGNHLDSIISKDGVKVARYVYGSGEELLEEITPSSTTRYEYGAQTGDVSRMILTNGTKTQVYGYDYNAQQELVKISDFGDGTQRAVDTRFGYDSLGREYVTRTDGVTPYYFVDAGGRTWAFGVPGEVSVSYNYTLNRAQNTYSVAKTVQGEGTETSTFGLFGLLSTTHTDGRISRVAYSANGFLSSATGADGVVVKVKRDAQGRDTGADILRGANLESWVTNFDSQDRVASVVRTLNNQTSTFAVTRRGEFGEILQTQHTEPGRAPLTYSYDRNGANGYEPGAVFGMSVGGASWKNEVDPSTGQLTGVTFTGGRYTATNPAKFKFSYNGAIQSGVTYPAATGLDSVWSYARGLLSDVIISKNGQPAAGAQFERDSMGRLTAQRTLAGAGQGKSFEYIQDRLAKSKEPVSVFGSNYTTSSGAETRNVYDPANPQQLRTRTLASGKVVNYVSDGKGAYSSIDGMAIKYDALRRMTAFGPFTYTYRGSSLLPVEVRKSGKLIRTFIYDMFNNLMASVDAAGRREDYLTVGTTDLGKLDAATGNLTTAYVNFPGVAREKLAAINMSGGTDYFYTNLTSTQRNAAYDQNGNLVEKYETNLAAGTYSTLAPNGAVRASSVTPDNAGFHGLRTFPDAGPGGLAITPLRAFFSTYSVANSPDPLQVPQQMFSHNDNDPVNRMDPTGGQTAYDFRTDRIFSDPNKAAEFHEANVKLAEAIFVNEWKTEGGNWWADTGLSVLQKTVQGVVIAPLAIGIVGPVVAAAPAVGIGLGVFGLGAGTFQTASDISSEGFTPDNMADLLLLGGSVATGPRLWKPKAPASSTATGSAAVSATDEITDVTQTASQAVCKKCEPLDLWAADRANAEEAIELNYLMNARPIRKRLSNPERLDFIFGKSRHPDSWTPDEVAAKVKADSEYHKRPVTEKEVRMKLVENYQKSQDRHALMKDYGWSDTPENRKYIIDQIEEALNGPPELMDSVRLRSKGSRGGTGFEILRDRGFKEFMRSMHNLMVLELRWSPTQPNKLNTIIPQCTVPGMLTDFSLAERLIQSPDHRVRRIAERLIRAWD